jgi:hypothetical protein
MNPGDLRAIDVRAGGRLKIDQKACSRGRDRESPVLQTRVNDAAMPRNLNELNIDLPKGKLLQNLLRIYIVFNERNQRILCVLINDTLERIQAH